jgi:hypothetical protein
MEKILDNIKSVVLINENMKLIKYKDEHVEYSYMPKTGICHGQYTCFHHEGVPFCSVNIINGKKDGRSYMFNFMTNKPETYIRYYKNNALFGQQAQSRVVILAPGSHIFSDTDIVRHIF